MKARLPKSFLDLPKREKEIIEKVYRDSVESEVNRYFALLQKNWLKMSCIVLHDFCGASKDDCLIYLANFKAVYRENGKKDGNEAQQEWLAQKMEEIFGVGGFPKEYLDKLEEM